MDEETKKLIQDNYALNKENNEMLKKLIFFQKWNQALKIITWVFIILSSVGALYFIQKNLGSLISVYTGGVGVSDMGSISDISKSFGDKSQIEDLIKSLNGN